MNNYELGWKSTSLNGHLVWNGAAYVMDWKQFQTIIYDPTVCAPISYYVNVGDARIYGGETNADYKINDNWSLQAAATYDDARIISSPYAAFQQEVNERLPFSPYFSWSWNVRYEAPLNANMKGYAQFDVGHKGDMWNDLVRRTAPSPGYRASCNRAYTLMNVRFGLNPAGRPLARGAVRLQPRRQERDRLQQHRQLRPAADHQRAARVRAAGELPLRQGSEQRLTPRGCPWRPP